MDDSHACSRFAQRKHIVVAFQYDEVHIRAYCSERFPLPALIMILILKMHAIAPKRAPAPNHC